MWKTFYQEPFISASYILKASLNDVARRHISTENILCFKLMDYLQRKCICVLWNTNNESK